MLLDRWVLTTVAWEARRTGDVMIKAVDKITTKCHCPSSLLRAKRHHSVQHVDFGVCLECRYAKISRHYCFGFIHAIVTSHLSLKLVATFAYLFCRAHHVTFVCCSILSILFSSCRQAQRHSKRFFSFSHGGTPPDAEPPRE